jgi:hypothetical protein
MGIDSQEAIADIDKVLSHQTGTSGTAAVSQVCAVTFACIERWAPPGSSYRRMLKDVSMFGPKNTRADMHLQGILTSLRRDYAEGMAGSFEEMVHASMFDDLLEQAKGLLEAEHLLAATVVSGATLESHLRELAAKHQVPTTDQKKNKTIHRTASALNDDLHAKAKAYSTTEFRQVQVWIDLRNEAAHAKAEFQTRTEHDVGSMINGIREFMVRNPA